MNLCLGITGVQKVPFLLYYREFADGLGIVNLYI